MISYLISRRMQREPLFHVVALQDGLDLPSVEELRETPVLIVEDAMAGGSGRLLDGELPVRGARRVLGSPNAGSCLVALASGDWRELTRSALEEALRSGDPAQPLASLPLSPPVDRIYPDVSLDTALKRLASAGILPVVSRANPKQLLGTLTLGDVLEAYGVAGVPAPTEGAVTPS